MYLALLQRAIAGEDDPADVALPSTAADPSAGQGTGGPGTGQTAAGGFEVVARAVDAEEEVRVFAHAEASLESFRVEVLHRLQRPSAQQEHRSYRFVCDGQLLGDEGRVSECQLRDGSRIIVVPPQCVVVRPSGAGRGWSGACRPSVCLRRLRAIGRSLLNFPGALLRCLLEAWRDPWSLVRPPDREEGQGRGRRIHGFRINARSLRYGPGQNPRGEDLTMLFTQGLVGGGGGG